MLALLAACVLSVGLDNPPLPPAAPPPPRVRRQLKNGATILVEPFPRAEQAHVVFVASARGVEETRATHGLRHLLEHLVLIGDGDLEFKLETVGGFLTAKTTRDALEVSIQVPPDQLPVALATVRRLLQPIRTTPEAIANEVRIMREEKALRETALLHSAAAWATAYGDAALDPFGDLDVMATATPDSLEALRLRKFRPSNLVVAVAGPVDAQAVAAQVADLLEGEPDLGPTTLESRPASRGGAAASEGKGSAAALPVGDFGDPRTAAAIAAGLAIAARADRGWFIYTPSARAGMVLAGDESGPLDRVLAMDPALLYGLGRQLARDWLARQLRDPGSSASLRAQLLAQGFGNRPETLAENIERIGPAEFAEAFLAFGGPNAVRVGPMIASLAAGLALLQAPQAPPARVIVQPTSLAVEIQAVVKLPPMGPRDRAAAAVLAEVLLGGTPSFNRFDYSDPGAFVARRTEAWAMPDHLRISLATWPDRPGTGLSMLLSMLKEPKLDETSLNEALARVKARPQDPWWEALRGERYPFEQLRARDIDRLAAHVLRPENVFVAIGGPVDPNVAKLWTERVATWQPDRRPPPWRPDPGQGQPLAQGPGGVGYLHLEGPSVKPDRLPAQLLALVALGTGKGSSLWRAVRQGQGLSYRQEALLWPTTEGFAGRLALQSTTVGAEGRLDAVREALRKDVAAWTEADLARAKGALRGVLTLDWPVSPLLFEPGRPVGSTLRDRTFLEAYWSLKTGRGWDERAILEQAEALGLADIRAQAEPIVSSPSNVRLLP